MKYKISEDTQIWHYLYETLNKDINEFAFFHKVYQKEDWNLN